MSRLPPAEKLPLAVRKNIRDDWENKREDFQKQLSDVLGTEWTLKDISPVALYPYAEESYAKERLGSCIESYVESAIYNLKQFVEKYGEDGKSELNSICHARSLTIDLDDRPEEKRVSYCGVIVKEGGVLAIVFSEGCLGVNVYSAVETQGLLSALNAAPPAPGSAASMNFAARTSVRRDYDPQIEETRKSFADMLERPEIKLCPNFEANFEKMKAAAATNGSEVRSDWEANIGAFTRMYFEGMRSQMRYQKFDDDDMLREGFNEAAEKGEIHFRIVDKMAYATYGEVVLDDGLICLQTQAHNFGTNVDYAAEKLLDQL
ncbi:hypothetical protein HER10_EVM0004082 [Colletotrichum scovillei]|uniref:Uncharacterized protein n=1 Tax=Colletotrichum scovillei TaxID=1209932 RepID=A0A9P7U9W6_9PEZI|nr:uncharacterized protein HER10_EVM0004082 [Colletotrichum scovillei]KAF4774857.1 hypothetical protein HER10_EVM0004082 [Colletotrichum scovillei]KAG7042861.1 hypothetical protein JMJ78_0006367 [Colletotrichum scovillei]KAG7043449.1 hypothetical protein JMJ77_0003154 [Colletotrichum scovillei]KAG7062896.1 hypothetical protein JMJ76_0009738 [Colletotrichum scovillei]